MLVISKDLVGCPRVQDGQAGAVQRDFVELVGKAAPGPITAQAGQTFPECLRTASVFVSPVSLAREPELHSFKEGASPGGATHGSPGWKSRAAEAGGVIPARGSHPGPLHTSVRPVYGA